MSGKKEEIDGKKEDKLVCEKRGNWYFGNFSNGKNLSQIVCVWKEKKFVTHFHTDRLFNILSRERECRRFQKSEKTFFFLFFYVSLSIKKKVVFQNLSLYFSHLILTLESAFCSDSTLFDVSISRIVHVKGDFLLILGFWFGWKMNVGGSEAEGSFAGPPPSLEWKFSQVFGERTAGEEVQEGWFFFFFLSLLNSV